MGLAPMPDSSFYRDQADRFHRVADQCSVPDLAAYYRKLADAYRQRAEKADLDAPMPRGQPRRIEFPD